MILEIKNKVQFNQAVELLKNRQIAFDIIKNNESIIQFNKDALLEFKLLWAKTPLLLENNINKFIKKLRKDGNKLISTTYSSAGTKNGIEFTVLIKYEKYD